VEEFPETGVILAGLCPGSNRVHLRSPDEFFSDHHCNRRSRNAHNRPLNPNAHPQASTMRAIPVFCNRFMPLPQRSDPTTRACSTPRLSANQRETSLWPECSGWRASSFSGRKCCRRRCRRKAATSRNASRCGTNS
jgi:hypothetical protein